MAESTRVMQAPGEIEWACEYEFRGERWSAPGIYASSRAEAEAKLRAIGSSGVVLGELAFKTEVPVLLIGARTALLAFVVGAIAGVFLERLL